MSLRLVRPPDGGQDPTPAPRRRHPAQLHSLTPEEHRNLRQALLNLRMRYGSWSCLAEVMAVPKSTLSGACKTRAPKGSPGLALRTARAAGTTVEHILSGKIAPVGTCPTCGSTAAERRAS